MMTQIIFLIYLITSLLTLHDAFNSKKILSNRYNYKNVLALYSSDDATSVTPVPDVTSVTSVPDATVTLKDTLVTDKVADLNIEVKGGSYILCSSCKTAYPTDEKLFTARGLRVRCSICEKEWFQSLERLMKVDNLNEIVDMTEAKVTSIKKMISEQNWPKYPRVDKVGLFIGNVPYLYSETDLSDLFAEYGLVGVSLVRDTDGQSKGFAFIEVSSMEEAERVVDEMHLFHTDSNRKLTVRLQTAKSAAGGSRPPPQQSSAAGQSNRSEKTWTPKK